MPTTDIGHVNKHNQQVLEDTGKPGNGANQRMYKLQCLECGEVYGANGADIWERRCPNHDNGCPGLPL
jgi:hypothetical protein